VSIWYVIVSAGGQLYIPAVWPRSALWRFRVVPSSRAGSGFRRPREIQHGTETQDATPCATDAGKPDIFPHDLTELDTVSPPRGSAGRRRVWNDHLQFRFWLWLGIQQCNIPWAGEFFLSCLKFFPSFDSAIIYFQFFDTMHPDSFIDFGAI